MAERKVVLAVDGSAHSSRAFDFYSEHLYHENDMVLVIHAFELPIMPAAPVPAGYAYYDEWKNLVQRAEHDAQDLLKDVGKKVVALCGQHEHKVKLFKENGSAGEVICNFSKDMDASLIVLGSRGLGTLRRTFLGSVSDYCVHHAHIPVAVVPPPQEHEESKKD